MRSPAYTISSLFGFCLLVSARNGSIVDVGYAKYRGGIDYGVNYWFGIRYAQSPAGNLRWRAPQPIEAKNNYSSTIDASALGPACYQGIPEWQFPNATFGGAPATTESEDCLLLDVLTPEKPAGTALPVVLFFHGGGYNVGSAETYSGFTEVSQSNGSLIWVSAQHRLSAFGFLSSSEIRDDGSANTGLLDQRLALEWIQRHISAFGGDPSKVTIWGNSAGGGSAMNQMILYGGDPNPPFSAVVAQYPWWQPYHNDTILEDQYQELLNATSCAGLACLRSLDSQTLAKAVQSTYAQGYTSDSVSPIYGFGDFYYGPSVDGDIIRDLPSNEFKQGHFSKVALLVDHDGYEGTYFSNQSETTLTEETTDLRALFPAATDTFFTRLYELYPASDFNSTFFQRQTIFGDFIISCPTYYMATAVSDAGLPVYKLVFNAGSEQHGASQPFLLDVPPSDANNRTLGLLLRDYYISFAVAGDPNAVSYSGTPKPAWPGYKAIAPDGTGNFSVLSINYTMIGAIPDYDASERCDFFYAESYVVRN